MVPSIGDVAHFRTSGTRKRFDGNPEQILLRLWLTVATVAWPTLTSPRPQFIMRICRIGPGPSTLGRKHCHDEYRPDHPWSRRHVLRRLLPRQRPRGRLA